MVKELLQAVVGPIFAGFWSHLNLPRYGALQYLAVNRGIREYALEEDFWHDLIAGDGPTRLEPGDVVKLFS